MGLLTDLTTRLVRNDAPPMRMPSSVGYISGGVQTDYQRFARAYSTNEIIYACIDLLSDSAGEPQIVGRRYRRESPATRQELRGHMKRLMARGLSWAEADERMIRNGFYEVVPKHPLVNLLNHPNPLNSRGQLWGTVVLDRQIAGNAYLLKGRGQLGNTMELWRLRPDRVKIIPKVGGIEAYEYNTDKEKVRYPAEDVLHFKERNTLDDYYGYPPLAVLMDRIAIDNSMRGFLRDFYERGGSGPGAVLSVKQKLKQDEKDEVRERLARQFSGGNVGKTLVIDANEHTYTQLGLNRGLRDALPQEIDASIEARIAMVFRIPGSIVGLKIGYESSSYANKRQDWQVFWDLTMTPLLSDSDDVLNLGLVPEFGGVDDVAFDLGDIRALQEDVDKLHQRAREDFFGGLAFWEEARESVGYDPDGEGTLVLPSNMTVVRVSGGQIIMPAPVAPPAPKQIAAPADIVEEVHCPKCGRWVGRNMNVGATAYCPKDKEVLVTMPVDEPKVVSIDIVRDEDGRVSQLVGAAK